MPQLTRISKEYKLPVIAIEYAPPGELALARETARRVAQLGFTPWVANSELEPGRSRQRRSDAAAHPHGVPGHRQSVRPHGSPRAPDRAMPLNYLGYMVDYVDITNQPLPAGSLAGRYAGVSPGSPPIRRRATRR
jgi:hypothetical protein